jgi:hypothetical protein
MKPQQPNNNTNPTQGITANDLVVGGKYVPHSKSVGNPITKSNCVSLATERNQSYIFYNGYIDGNYLFNASYDSENITGDFFLPSDVTPYAEPNQTTMEYTEQPFNLETALKHPEWVYFRNGEKPLEWHWFEKINSEWVIFAINQTGGTSLCRKDGTYSAALKIESPYDLILRVPYREVWVNIYDHYNLFETQEQAGKAADNNRIACVPVKIPA